MVKFMEKLRGVRTSESEASEWDTVANMEFQREEDNGRRQQKKIEACLLTGDYDMLGEKSVDLPEEYEEEFLRKVGDGEIGLDEERGLLMNIRDPINAQGKDKMFEEISKSGHEKWIMAYMSGYDASNWQRVDSVDVAKFVHDFPTPIDFEEKSRGFLDAVRGQVSEIEYGAYEGAMKDFKGHIYGKRQEYWEQMKVLNERAREVGVKEMAPEMREALIQNARIEGDNWQQGGREYRLTPETLERSGVGPKYEVGIEGTQICLSDVFMEDTNGRVAAIAYIPTKDGVKVRGYYKSNSQGTWRYLPDYVKGEDSAGIEWYGKGSSEESLTLPLKLQEALAKIQSKGVVEDVKTNPAFLLAGTAYRYSSKEEYSRGIRSGQMRGDFYREVNRSAAARYGGIGREKMEPETLELSSEQMPDFRSEVAEFETVSNLVGNVRMEGYKSIDGKTQWNFCRDDNGRAWIGGVEAVSPITSTGLRRDWVEAGDFATPLYEYESQTGGYGDTGDMAGHYQGMWKNYLVKTPMIRRYLASRGTR